MLNEDVNAGVACKARYTLATKLNSTRSTLWKVDKVGRIGNKVHRDKMSNSRCCRFVAKTGNRVECTATVKSLPICRRFRQQSIFNKVDRVEFNFVAGVYRA